jgi:hypothetical protein
MSAVEKELQVKASKNLHKPFPRPPQSTYLLPELCPNYGTTDIPT